ncbi:MAG TPA: hypothetical protein VGM03_01350 [Phycisphaerae bacterium]|jgi:hypothetical protein
MSSIRTTVYAFTVLGALTGLLVLFASAAERHWYAAAGGFAIFAGFMLLLGMSHTFSEALRSAAEAAVVRRDLLEIHERLNALEAFVDLCRAEVNLSATGTGDPAPLVAATLERDTFPRIVLPDSRAPDDHGDQAGVYDRDLSNRLRQRFGDQVRAGDYAGALDTGIEMLRAFPGSALAREFQSIRPHLEARLPAPAGRVLDRDNSGLDDGQRDVSRTAASQ